MSSTGSISPDNATTSQETNQSLHPLDRLRQLEQLYLSREPYHEAFSQETLLDTLVCLYDECCNSTLRKDKTVSEFVEFGMLDTFIQPIGFRPIINFCILARPVVSRIKALRLCRDDFEVLKVIGRGSFGEVAVVKLLKTDKVRFSLFLIFIKRY